MTIAKDRRSFGLTAGLLAIALGVGALSGVDPKIGLAAAMGLAFVTIVMADLTIGLCIFALLAFMNVIPETGSFVSFDKVAGGLLALSWLATVANRREARKAFVSAHPLFFGVIVFFLVWVLLSLTWAEWPSVGVTPASRYVLDAFLFLIVFTTIRARRHVIWLTTAFVTASVLSAAYGLFVPPPSVDQDRLAGTIGEPNQLAAVLIAGLVLSLALAVIVRGRPLTRLILVFSAVLCLLTNFLTLSRAGLIALAATMVVSVFVAGRWRVVVATTAVFVLGAILIFFNFVATPDQRARVTSFGNTSGRSDIWTVGWRMVQAHPVTGIGVGQFQQSSVHYLIAPGAIQRSDLIVDKPKVAHNIYLQVLAELGIVGLIPFVIILGFSLSCAMRAAHAFERRGDGGMELLSRGVFLGLVGILTADFFASEQFSKQLWLLLGLAPALLAIATRSEEEELFEGDGTVEATPPPFAPRRLEPAPATPPLVGA